jgi:hypothetical protein
MHPDCQAELACSCGRPPLQGLLAMQVHDMMFSYDPVDACMHRLCA